MQNLSMWHVQRDFRGIEFGSPCYFENKNEGFENFLKWISEIKKEQSMDINYYENLKKTEKSEEIAFFIEGV